jgi:hypothetical protein
LVGVELAISGIESHNSLGVGERYHGPLRQIYDPIMDNSERADPVLALKVAVKTMNDTLGPEELVPSLLVFGSLPRPVGAFSAETTERCMASVFPRAQNMMALSIVCVFPAL